MTIKIKDETPKELVARVEHEADKVLVSITHAGREHRVWFAASGADLGKEPDFLVPLTLFPAMASGSRLRLPDDVSPRLLTTIPKIQDIFRLWAAEYWATEHWDARLQGVRGIPVDAGVRDVRSERASGIACLFSGGVDSFHTLLKHREEITHIVFVHGFDIALTDTVLRAQASHMAREVAKELGKSLIEVETNLRSFSNRAVGWPEYHGAALASVALLFQHQFRKVLIAATQSYAGLIPWGSHPMLDPLWSTELTEFEHDGSEATRVDKVAYISGYEPAMRWLRVCFKNPDDAYNCGRCKKCLYTMINLRIAGVLEQCETLPNDLDLEEIANLFQPGPRLLSRQTLRALERLGTEPELAEAVAKSLAASEAATPEYEREQLRRQLSIVRERLEQTRTTLEASRKRAQSLKARNDRLAEQNRLLRAGGSGRRERFVEAMVQRAPRVALKVPGIGKLLRRERATEDGRLRKG